MLGLGLVRDYTSSTALMHPSFSGLLVTCAYLPHTTCSGPGVGVGVGLGLALGRGLEFGLVFVATLPEGVTRPRSEQLTSMMVPLVITPRDV